MRFLARSKTVRSARWQGLLWTTGFTWLLVFAFFGASLKAGLIGLLAALISALIYPAMYRQSVQKRLRKLCKEKVEDTTSFICEVELKPTGLWTRSLDTQTTSEWKNVEELVVTEDSVDIFTRQGGGVVVRNKAFQSVDERQAFIELAQRFIAQSREAHNSAS
jgi:hypothetical protein